MEAVITALQVMVMCLITYWMVSFQMEFYFLFFIVYVLAMASTAMAVMLGCSVEDAKLATEMLPILFVPQMLFAGFFVAPDLIPSWLQWAQYVCSLTYAVRIALVEEFNGCGSEGSQALENCQRLINDTKADPDETFWNWLVLVGLFIFFRLLALYILRQKAAKFF
jgi:ABC-type multidrug transport system permease subunit